jgi:hypothetical protein
MSRVNEDSIEENAFISLDCTTSKKKYGFLLIEVFRKLINPQNYGYLDRHEMHA